MFLRCSWVGFYCAFDGCFALLFWRIPRSTWRLFPDFICCLQYPLAAFCTLFRFLCLSLWVVLVPGPSLMCLHFRRSGWERRHLLQDLLPAGQPCRIRKLLFFSEMEPCQVCSMACELLCQNLWKIISRNCWNMVKRIYFYVTFHFLFFFFVHALEKKLHCNTLVIAFFDSISSFLWPGFIFPGRLLSRFHNPVIRNMPVQLIDSPTSLFHGWGEISHMSVPLW